MNLKTLLELRHYLTVKHHVPGRIRIGFQYKLLADPKARSIRDQTSGKTMPPCIKSTKINMLTRNIIIEYDQDVIQPEVLHEVLTTSDESRFLELAAELESVLDA